MSLESNLHKITERFTKDQNSIANAFRLEILYRKYKVLIFTIVFIFIAGIIFFTIHSYRAKQILEESNQIFSQLREMSNDESKLQERKKLEEQLQHIAPVLYDFYIYTQLQDLPLTQLMQEENLAKLQNLFKSKNELIATLAIYQHAILTQDLHALESFYSKWIDKKETQSSYFNDILRDRALLQAAYIYLQNDNIAKAHELLDSITLKDGNQYIFKIAKELRHYGLLDNALNSQTIQSNNTATNNQ
ncbi:hypothetical protein CQA66_00315 [Helicobacter aurati]|uniref:50S ribosomal protein L22 n=1 Tax=Helicobacter aurati TaxID=137778 RepID=A0A3D8J830_9HELI|nr:hypothetical protein [Helicobacter aurati]RDU73673.1 hypothetical protein CQA66_00315 [Helicobacter aurati]